MTPELWHRVTQIFRDAVARGPAEREAFLANACQGDTALRGEVDALLSGNRDAEGFGDEALPVSPSAVGVLASGTAIGPYRLEGLLGAGGMGDVYRARDTKLQRDVALKILRAEITRTWDGRARLEREAVALAKLSHPHIAHVYGFEESAGIQAIIMELVPGRSLDAIIASGPCDLGMTLDISQQIAEALDAAHEAGIIHRDLKPANIKVTPDGVVKLLDFGLAKIFAAGGLGSGAASRSAVTLAATQVGIIVGTPAYMSPEQTRGEPVDKRADVWAFGCVLFELLTGRRPFEGESPSDVLARVLERDPNWTLLPDGTSAPIRTLLARCLEKDPRRRLRDIGDARFELERIRTQGAGPDPGAVTIATRAPRHFSRRGWLEAAGVVLAGAALAFVAWPRTPPATSSSPIRSFTIALPPGQQLATNDLLPLAFSDDGNALAYVAETADGSAQQIYVRAMDSGTTTPVVGTEGATTPFFSPDGQWLGFFARGRLMKAPVKGGVATVLTDVPAELGATWSEHHIVFASLWSALEQIGDQPADTPRGLTRFAGAENAHTWPRAIPNSDALLFVSNRPDAHAIALADGPTSEHRDVLRGQGVFEPSYVNSGHLVYLQGNNLMAAPMDLAKRKVDGDAVLAVARVRQYAVSPAGSLAYSSGNPPDRPSRLTWVTRTGAAEIIDDRADLYYQPRLDPIRGDRVVMDLNGQVWMFDLATHNLTPFTFGDLNQHAIWTRDGKRLVFMTQRGRTWQISAQDADGRGKPQAETTDPGRLDIPYSTTPDGTLAFVKYSGTAESELWILPPAPPRETAAERVFSIPIADAETGPGFSPDGRWLAYAAGDADGRRQIYVQAYPGPGDKHQVSIDGGNEPLWNPNPGTQPFELFYRNGDDMMAVDIAVRLGFAQSKPRRLFSGMANYWPVLPNYVRPNYDVSPDGQRFLMLQAVGRRDAPVTDIHVVLNWSEELKRVAPPAR
jgi:serine/threonine-protein kinase